MINKEDFVSKSEKLTTLHNQIYKFLLPNVLDENKDIHSFIKRSRAYNKHGAFIANYLQHLEFKILLALSAYSEKEGAFIDVLMHDGFLVRLTETVNEDHVNKVMIPKYEQFVLDQFKISMKYKVKPHDLSLVIPDIGDKTQLEIHTEALMMYCKKEQLRKFGPLVYKKKNEHPMYYEDYYDAYNQCNREKPKTLNDFFDEIFNDDKAFNSSTKHKDELFKYVSGKANFEDLPEMIRNTNYIAFKNGSLQLHPLKFFTFEEIVESSELNKYVARNYIDEEFSGSKETPAFDKLLLKQLSPEAYHILRVLTGRTFFDLNVHDGWQVAPYIQGDPHTGKSTYITCLGKGHGRDNVGTLNKNDKVFQLSSVYQKDLLIIPDIRDHKNYIDEDVVQTIMSGEQLTIRAMRTAGFTHKWNKPILFASNYPPDWSDSEGALRRRLVFFYFGNTVEEKDSTMDKKLEKEMANIIYRCVDDYLKFVAEHSKESDFSKLIPEDLLLLKDEFKTFSDPLSEYLSLGKTQVGDYYYSTVYQVGSVTPVEDFKKRFENWLGSTKHSQAYRVSAKNKEFSNCGFKLVSKKVCKSCGNPHIKDCCANYNSVNRTSKQYFENMYMMKERVGGSAWDSD